MRGAAAQVCSLMLRCGHTDVGAARAGHTQQIHPDTWTVACAQRSANSELKGLKGFFSSANRCPFSAFPPLRERRWLGGGRKSRLGDRLSDGLRMLPNTVSSHTRVSEVLAPLYACLAF